MDFSTWLYSSFGSFYFHFFHIESVVYGIQAWMNACIPGGIFQVWIVGWIVAALLIGFTYVFPFVITFTAFYGLITLFTKRV